MQSGLKNHIGKFWYLLAALLAGGVLWGCAPARQSAFTPPEWPPPPGEARIQFLASYAHSGQVAREDDFRKFVLGSQGLERRTLGKPQGLAATGGKLYVCDSLHGVQVVDFPHQEWRQLGEGRGGAFSFGQALAIASDEKGSLFVVDAEGKAVYVFDEQERFLRKIGEGVLLKPVGVAARQGKLFVSDVASNSIRVFDMQSGRYLEDLGPEIGEGKRMGFPGFMIIDGDDFLWVVDMGHRQVLRLDVDGHLLSEIGQLGDVSGTFTRPKGIGIDRQKRIWVVDSAFENVQLFNAEGRILTFFGGSGLRPGQMYLPAGIAISEDNLSFWQEKAQNGFQVEAVIFVSNQYGPNKLSVYGLGYRPAE